MPITQLTRGGWKAPTSIPGQSISGIASVDKIRPVDKTLTRIGVIGPR